MCFDIVIIGAGPSALAAAKRIISYNDKIKLIILEQGKSFEERDRDDPGTVSVGFGGAGLFTDGKLSLPPSATYLWTKLNKENVRSAYENVKRWLKEYEIDLPESAHLWFEKHEDFNGEKYYESYKLSVEQSEAIIKDFQSNLKNKLCLKTKVNKIKKDINKGIYIIETNDMIYAAKKIIVATGKVGYTNLFPDFDIKKSYLSEIGVRIAVPNEAFLPYNTDQLDYKLIKQTGDWEIRTFCCCKDGQVVKSKFENFYSFNGMIFLSMSAAQLIIVRRRNFSVRFLPKRYWCWQVYLSIRVYRFRKLISLCKRNCKRFGKNRTSLHLNDGHQRNQKVVGRGEKPQNIYNRIRSLYGLFSEEIGKNIFAKYSEDLG